MIIILYPSMKTPPTPYHRIMPGHLRNTAFSLACLKHISLTSFQYKIPFDVGTGECQSFFVWAATVLGSIHMHTMPSYNYYPTSFPGPGLQIIYKRTRPAPTYHALNFEHCNSVQVICFSVMSVECIYMVDDLFLLNFNKGLSRCRSQSLTV